MRLRRSHDRHLIGLVKILLFLASEIDHLLFLMRIVVLQLFLVSLLEGLLQSMLHHVLLQLVVESRSSLHDYFESVKHSASH